MGTITKFHRYSAWVIGLGLAALALFLSGLISLVWPECDFTLYGRDLHHSAALGDLKNMRWAVRKCPKALTYRGNESEGFLPIHTAVHSHRLDAVRELAALGSPLDVESARGETPLYLACSQGDTEIAHFLIDQGVTVNHNSRYNPLHAAVKHRDVGLIEKLLDKGADIDLTNQSGTPLRMAVVYNRPEIVRLLIDRGANKDKAGENGLTVIDEAALNNHQKIIDLLLENGTKRTLIVAIHSGDLQAVKHFVGEDPKIIHGGPGLNDSTPLHYAASFGQLAVCKWLIEQGADRAARSPGGSIAAHLAVWQKNGDVLRAVCTPQLANAQDDTGSTPLHNCAMEDNVEMARILVDEFKAFVNIRSNHGYTPLLLASERKHTRFCLFLLANNADVNGVATWPSGQQTLTPLHYSVLADPWSQELTELLLQMGADPHAKGVNGTPWEMAQRRSEVKKMFEKHMKE